MDTNVEYKAKTFDLINNLISEKVKNILNGYRILTCQFFVKPPGKGNLGPHQNNNFIKGEHLILQEVENSLIQTQPQKLTCIRGLTDFIIIDEPDVLLIYPKSEEQQIKKVTEYIKGQASIRKFL